MIVKQLNKTEFIVGFLKSSRKNQFSIVALDALYEYLEQLSDDIGEPIEFDIVAICCDFAEVGEDEANEENLITELENGKYLILNI